MRYAFLLVCFVASLARADFVFRNFDDPDAPKWQEEELRLPAFPGDEGLIEFSVDSIGGNRFFIDGTTLSIGKDGVVRYVVIVKALGGASNVSFEGIRCGVASYRLYATGRADGTWSPARLKDWRPIENKSINRHHAALNREFFCPLGSPITTVEEGREALRLGRHPSVP